MVLPAVLACVVLLSVPAPAQAVAQAPGSRRQVASPYAATLLLQMKQSPPTAIERGAMRVGGRVKSVGPDGILLVDAIAYRWEQVSESVAGQVNTRFKVGERNRESLNGLIFVQGTKAAVGQPFFADGVFTKVAAMDVDGRKVHILHVRPAKTTR